MEGCLEVSLVSKDGKEFTPKERQTLSRVCSRPAPRECKALAGLDRAAGPGAFRA